MKRLSLAWLLLCGLATAAQAQTYPDKPVRVVVPFPAGGAVDIVARHLAQKLSESLPAQFIVDNRAGAGGAIGTEQVARSAPDGYTLLLASSSSLSINPHLTLKQSYNPFTDLAPVIFLGYAPNVLVAAPSLPAKSLKELIELAKAKPESLTFASNGAGTVSHLTGEWFAQRLGVKILHVPYKGAAPAVIDTIAGQTSFLFAVFPSVSNHVKSGKLRALAVTSAKRMPGEPDLPAIAEILPGFESIQWWGLYGPAGLPQPIVARLNGELNKILRSADIKQKFAADGAVPSWGTPAELATYLKTDSERWAGVIKAAGIKPE
ncbi:MAG TPA: tripartite tricarboxylate transporter substrate binding protein [Burkholderiales bacterium]|jgi:tripartite-type tricarboxylate transporter receptor subunit TctC|nr:tripartite tricarboxylate transporter substrate binding protein [Burkholderiales bacterium]